VTPLDNAPPDLGIILLSIIELKYLMVAPGLIIINLRFDNGIHLAMKNNIYDHPTWRII
jgi:hypothetical protein